MFYRIICKIAYVLAKILFNISFEGLENVPENQGFLLCGNHRSNLDPVFAVIHFPKPVHFMAKEELFRNKLLAWFFSKLNAFPVARGTGDDEALEHAQRVLESNGALLVFQEGTRSKSIKPGRPRSGAALLSGRTGAGILPFTIDFGEKLRFRTKIVVKYHPFISKEELGIDLNVRSSIRTASKMVMSKITSGLSYLPKEETESEN